MSYCRWSSDFGECDVYVYEGENGWVTHVAGRRLRHRAPDEIREMFDGNFDSPSAWERWMAQENAVRDWRETLPSDEWPCTVLDKDGKTRPGTLKMPKDSEYFDLSEIGAQAGETYVDETPGACAERLEWLRGAGFNVPQGAIDALLDEAGGCP